MSGITDEHLILSALIKDKDYFNKVFPFIKSEYFHDDADKKIFNSIKNYSKSYNKVPDFTIIKNIITSSKLDDELIDDLLNKVKNIETIDIPSNIDYVVDKAESFCKNKALYNAIVKAYEIYDGTNKKETAGSIPDFIKDAISISFESGFGLEYFENGEERFNSYNEVEYKIPFKLKTLNAITKGGVTPGTLNLIAAGVNVGKTLMLIIMTAMYIEMGYDVFYASSEMSKMEIERRVDLCLMMLDTESIPKLGKLKYVSKLSNMKQKGYGRLYVKQYPTGTLTANKLEGDLRDLELKENFKPIIVMNDYLTICDSDKVSKNATMYSYYMSIAEEMRGLMIRLEKIMWSVAQLKTEAMESTMISLSQLSDSQGIARTADLVWAVYRNEDLDRRRELGFHQLKTRYHETKHVSWMMGLDLKRHQLIDNETDIEGITDMYKPINKPTMKSKDEKTETGTKSLINKDKKSEKKSIKFNTNREIEIEEYDEYLNI